MANGRILDAGLEEFLEGIDNAEIKNVLTEVYQRNRDQPEFLQAVRGITQSILCVFEKYPELITVYPLLLEPERQVLFRVPWVDDSGRWRVNRGYRIQFSSTLGPYKGGLRFHPSVNLSVMKFLGLEQTLKGALTGMPLGGAKGGSDFDPKHRSDREIMAFCQSFMTELYRHIGEDVDVPAGDMGVASKEIGYLYGQYKRITRDRGCALTGKGGFWGGSAIRRQATGYGVVMLAERVLRDGNDSLKGKRCVVSGAGNVAQFCAERLIASGAVLVTMSDSRGVLRCETGITEATLCQIMKIKSRHDGKLSDVEEVLGMTYTEGASPWSLTDLDDVFAAFPCATQNELDDKGAKALVAAGVKFVFEGANMPVTDGAAAVLKANGIELIIGKASNAGGVAVSGLEMAQNRSQISWPKEKVLEHLEEIMAFIHGEMKMTAREYQSSLVDSVNIAAFTKVARAMLDQGSV